VDEGAGVTREQLAAAVAKVGVMVKDVERVLGSSRAQESAGTAARPAMREEVTKTPLDRDPAGTDQSS
jgi:hypothetical protein